MKLLKKMIHTARQVGKERLGNMLDEEVENHVVVH
jgi:hypothetical protein